MELIGSKAYQAQLKETVAEMDPDDDDGTIGVPQSKEGMRDMDGWSYASDDDYEDSKMPAMTDGLTSNEFSRAQREREGQRQEAPLLPDQESVARLATKVDGIELALKKVASAMVQLAKSQAASREGVPCWRKLRNE